MPVDYREQDHIFTLSGGKISYVLGVTPDGRLMNLYWGARVPDGSVCCDLSDYPGFASFDLPEYWQPAEVPTLGSGWYGTPAVDAVNAQGDHVTDLRYAGHRILSGKKPLPGLPATYTEADGEAESLEIDLRDPLTGLEATALYTVYAASGALTRSIRIRNGGTAPITLRGVMSASVPLWGSDYDAVYLKGGWARERSVVRVPIGRTETCLYSQRGASGHESSPFLALCARNTDELSGEVWAASFVYSGSFCAKIDVNNGGNSRLSMGMNPQVFQWLLNPGEEFQAPEAVLVYSAEGFSGMSRIYHRLYRTRLARGVWRDRPRPVLVNNWEATYFNFNEEKILDIVREAKPLGIELFVLDDGWFGKRDIDNCSLGDWTADLRKLPNGIAGLSAKVHAEGLMFGIWVEPEMISPDSDLYRAHPDWCLHVDGRTRTLERNQLILDLSRKEVQDYVIDAICNVLRTGTSDYVKWDMNRNMTEDFSRSCCRAADGDRSTGTCWACIGCWRRLRQPSRRCCLKAAPAAADALTRVCCTTCRRPGPATTPTPSRGCPSSTARPSCIRSAPWAPTSAPCRTIRWDGRPPCRCAGTWPCAAISDSSWIWRR